MSTGCWAFWWPRLRSGRDQPGSLTWRLVRCGTTTGPSERLRGGQTIKVQAPIDTSPLFVRAGLIVPLGEPIVTAPGRSKESPRCAPMPVLTPTSPSIKTMGMTYAYEKGDSRITDLHWDKTNWKVHPPSHPRGPLKMRRSWR